MEAINQILESKGEPTKFAIVGISGIFVNLFVLFLSSNFFHVVDEIAYALGILLSMTTNYILNRIWTFESSKSLLPEYFRFIVYNSIGGLVQWFVSVSINNAINQKSFDILWISVITLYFASIIGIGFGFVFNFVTSKFFVFNSTSKEIVDGI